MLDISEYKTKDIYLAATLITRGFKQYYIQRNGRQCYFIFDQDGERNPQVEADNYWMGNLLVDPKELFNSYKELKNRMFNEDENERLD